MSPYAATSTTHKKRRLYRHARKDVAEATLFRRPVSRKLLFLQLFLHTA